VRTGWKACATDFKEPLNQKTKNQKLKTKDQKPLLTTEEIHGQEKA
jgi:hypothetical protein